MVTPGNKNKANSSKPKKSNKNKNKTQTRKKQQPSAGVARVAVDKCVQDYAESLLHPWSKGSPCIPLPPALPSLKQKFFIKGNLGTSSTTGFGYILASPYGAINDFGSTERPVFTSDANYGAYTASNDSVITGVNGWNTNSPYPGTSFGHDPDQMEGRVVSMGIRIRYTGTELNRGGVAYILETPDHQSMVGYDVTKVRSFDQCRAIPIGRQWITVTHQPVLAGEYAYKYTVGSNVHYLGILLSAANPLVSAPFEFEYYINVELIGAPARGKTLSAVEPDATHKIIGKIASMVNPSSYGITGKDIMDGMGYVVKNYSTAKAAVGLARLAIMN